MRSADTFSTPCAGKNMHFLKLSGSPCQPAGQHCSAAVADDAWFQAISGGLSFPTPCPPQAPVVQTEWKEAGSQRAGAGGGLGLPMQRCVQSSHPIGAIGKSSEPSSYHESHTLTEQPQPFFCEQRETRTAVPSQVYAMERQWEHRQPKQTHTKTGPWRARVIYGRTKNQ